MSRRQKIIERAIDQKDPVDPNPIEVGIPSPPSLAELVRRAVQYEVSGKAIESGEESFAESDDFEIDDDQDDLDWEGKHYFTELRPEGDDLVDDLNGMPDAPLSSHEQELLLKLQDRYAKHQAFQGEPEKPQPPEKPPVDAG